MSTIAQMEIEQQLEEAKADVSHGGQLHGVYRHGVQQYGLTVTGPRWTTDGLKATVKVEDGPQHVLHEGELNLMSLRDKETLARFLKEAAPGQSWASEVAAFFSKVTAAERASAAPLVLREVEKPTAEPVVEVGGIPILRDHPALLFGEGETYKSMLALWIAGHLAIDGVKVLYLDWELDAPDHRARLDALFGDSLPDVRYLRCDAPLLQMVSKLGDACRRDGIDYLVVDSVSFAIGIAAETSEAATSYYAALRQIGVGGSLSIAHSTKRIPKADRGREKPFGSVFWHNGARMTWLATSVLRGEQSSSVQLDCRKSNLVRRPTTRLALFVSKEKRIALTVREQGSIEPTEPQLEGKRRAKTIGARIKEFFDNVARPSTWDEIRNALPDLNPDSLRITLGREGYLLIDGERYWSETRLGKPPKAE